MSGAWTDPEYAGIDVQEDGLFMLTFYDVGHDDKREGMTIIGDPLSPPYKEASAAKEELASIKAKVPDAYITQRTLFFNVRRPSDLERYREVEASLI